MNPLKLLSGLLALALLAACASPVDPAAYAKEKPVLDLQEYFNGTVDAWGMFQDRSGKVSKRFTVVIDCRWEGDTGTLDEHFSYSDGTHQRRVWTLHKTGPNRFIGRAADVVGDAVGEVAGNALRWRYVLQLPVDGKIYDMQMEDWMYLVDRDVMLNRAVMRKFGFTVGSVTLSFRKRR